MKAVKILLVLTNLICWSESKPNQCCSNNLPLIPKKGCMGNGTSYIRQTCKKAYAIYPDEKDVQIDDDDTLLVSNTAFIPRDRYCVGSIETENNTVMLVCFPDAKGISSNKIAQCVCMIVSVLSLLATLVVYIVLPRLRDVQGKCIMATIFSLLLSFCFIGSTHTYINFSYSSCYFIANSIYFWILCSFFWMNIVAFHIWRSMINPSFSSNHKAIFRIYNMYGWGGPLIFLIIANIAHHVPGSHLKPKWALKSCFFSDFHSSLLYFNIPLFILISANIIMFILSGWALRRQINEPLNNKLRSRKYKFLLCLKLFLIMGVCWIFEPMSFVLQYEFLSNIWLITDLINALQGLVIFLLLVVFRKRVRRDLARHKGICCRKLPQDWATIADEDCEEVTEEAENLTANCVN